MHGHLDVARAVTLDMGHDGLIPFFVMGLDGKRNRGHGGGSQPHVRRFLAGPARGRARTHVRLLASPAHPAREKASGRKNKINLLASASHLPLRTAMASTACLPRAFLPARTRSATSSSPRHASLKCSAYNTKTGFGSHSVPVAPTTPPRGAVADDVEFVDLNRLRPPPAPLPGPTVRDPRWLPRTTTALVDSGFD
jgi:hypothetical protein